MSKKYNKTIVIGRLGKEPVIHKTTAGRDACGITLASTIVRNGVEEVQWQYIRVYGKQAKLVMEHIHKGDLVCIEGKNSEEEYIDKDGFRKWHDIIIAERITFLISKRQNAKTEQVKEAERLSEEYISAHSYE